MIDDYRAWWSYSMAQNDDPARWSPNRMTIEADNQHHYIRYVFDEHVRWATNMFIDEHHRRCSMFDRVWPCVMTCNEHGHAPWSIAHDHQYKDDRACIIMTDNYRTTTWSITIDHDDHPSMLDEHVRWTPNMFIDERYRIWSWSTINRTWSLCVYRNDP